MDSLDGANYVLRALELFTDYGDQEAIVWRDHRLTYTELTSMILSFAAGLRERHVEPGSTVAVLAPDHPEAPALQMALHLLGCRAVWIASYAPAAAQVDYINLAKPDLLIYHPDMISAAPPVAAMIAAPGGLPEEGGLPALSVSSPGSKAAVDLVADPAFAGGEPHDSGPEPESLFYTGGTTGTPKLVRHRQRFYDVMLTIAAFYLYTGEPAMRFLNGSSFSHVSGQLSSFLTLFEGGTLFLGQNATPGEFLATIERERVSSTFLTPALLYEVIDHPAAATTDMSSMRYLNVGGGPASPARLEQAIDTLGPVVRLVYGASEAPLITDLPFLDHDPEHPERIRSCGQAFSDSLIEIRGSDGAPLPAGEAGEVWVGGSLIMNDYWMQPELTEATVRDGWLRTGDIGYLDDDGYLYLVDRMHDMIVTSTAAANVYARPIEDALASHPQVKTAAVVGVPDATVGEVVHAFVVRAPGADISADELRALVRARLNNLYTPRGIDFVDELPLTPIGKIDKKVLRQRAGRPAATQDGQATQDAQAAQAAARPPAPPG